MNLDNERTEIIFKVASITYTLIGITLITILYFTL